ncbi:MAG: DUF4296 domain-containing protein [Flavobacteriales bacterium]|nr:DUF4296 domain-containing protein [Flavobacteriales bacterium]
MRWALILPTLVLACSGVDDGLPDGVLPKERFSDVLLESYLIEARSNQEFLGGRASARTPEEHYAAMFERLGTSKEQFDRSFTYWSERPAEFKVMHEHILNELSRRKDELAQ